MKLVMTDSFRLLVINVLLHCWLGVSKNIWPVKIECWGAGVVICLEQSANDLHMVHSDATQKLVVKMTAFSGPLAMNFKSMVCRLATADK